MEKQNIDWSNIGFGYMKTGERFVANYKDGKWDDGVMTTDATVTISECAGVLQYAQTCFEGMKAYTTADGRIVVFRPDLNAQRMEDSCKRLEMPVFPKEKFVDAICKVVKANSVFVPPYGTGATLYIRPYMFGSSAVIGVKPAEEYQFRVFTTPVGPYFKGGAKPITIKVSDFDRAAPHGTGHIKAGLNYAMSLHAIVTAHQEGFDENMYLDAATRTKVEETGGANFLFVTKGNKVVTPKSNSILPSITRRSLMYVAEHYLGLEVEQREVYFDEVKDFAECGLCGTAAVISPVGKINDHGKEICFPSGMEEMGPVTKKLYETLTGIQMGKIEAPEGWIKEIK
ncbi:branched-chain amino acid aminotransferase [Ruminococcus sp. YE282]|jgi:branched-chain amino acid aminotransferase|uniref:branched-chain amino acid aminotransferase n=1 Tax=Ruminococcus sp. YE282 TaxID=3158780 RepID=UPI000885423B|nr:branched-chain amino acid aminotransferase [Ruminococcus bromii]SCY72395.1 branched-chain amino acid aminotransferase [Ruminococcus bromii]